MAQLLAVVRVVARPFGAPRAAAAAHLRALHIAAQAAHVAHPPRRQAAAPLPQAVHAAAPTVVAAVHAVVPTVVAAVHAVVPTVVEAARTAAVAVRAVLTAVAAAHAARIVVAAAHAVAVAADDRSYKLLAFRLTAIDYMLIRC